MTTATRRPQTGSGPLIDPQLASLLERQDQVAAAAGHRAVEVIREWMLAQDRSWLAVDFTKTRPEPPFADDEGLAAAVRALPRRAFGSGLDLRGSFIVRLQALNAILGLMHTDRTPMPPMPRLEVVVAGDDVTVFLDGAQLDGAAAYVVGAGRQRSYRQWMAARDAAIDQASPAAAVLLRKFYDQPPASAEIAGATAGWPGERR